MENLESLNVEYNSIKDISPVEGKTKLKRITLQQNEITDISVLSGCTSLESVIISYNYITTLSPLYGLANLTEVRAYEEIGKKKIDQGSIDDLVGAGVEVYYHR
jgi:Leucine-rich repeat (LRR) protein